MSSTLYIHLAKLDQNLEVVKTMAGRDVKVMAVVKDEAYGHGLLPIAKHLSGKVEWFCLAGIDEAVRLRKSGIENPILVFEIPKRGKEDLYREYNVTASISDLSVFERLKPGTDCHLHFDTGMMRLGMLPMEVPEVLQKMKDHPELNYSGIYTHFANADGEAEPSVNHQLEVFKDIRVQFPDDLMCHTSNSAGVLYHSSAGLFDAVRPGISLYGFAPGEEIEGLEPVAEWISELVQVKRIQKGEAVGYGSRWKAPEDGWLGIVPVGYSDGLFRSMSNKFRVEIAGEMYQQAGTISMDYFAVFLENQTFEVGEKVTILKNGEMSAKEWAQKMGTISYEITTSISPKVKRVYLEDDGV